VEISTMATKTLEKFKLKAVNDARGRVGEEQPPPPFSFMRPKIHFGRTKKLSGCVRAVQICLRMAALLD